jgi:hypothetical protein
LLHAQRKATTVNASFSFEGRTYRPQLVRCGKQGCKTCSRKGGHGPYWYAFWKVKARTVSRYIGKVLPPGITPPATAVAAPPGWRLQRCTPATVQVVLAAWQLADFGRVYPEHVLLALARAEEGLGPRALHAAGIDESVLRPMMTSVSIASVNFIGRRLAGLAASEARRWHDPAIGTEHLVLAVLRLRDIPMVTALTSRGAGFDRVLAHIIAARGVPDSGKRCAGCRKPLRAAWHFCPHCGVVRAEPDRAVLATGRAEILPNA